MIKAIGHVALQVPDLNASVEHAVQMMGLREVERREESAYGHHHYSWEVEGLPELGRLGDLLDAQGRCFLWGPGRHGAGDNIFTYHHDPAGAIVEYYADMERIYDDARRPRRWDISDRRAANMWGATCSRDFIEDGLPHVSGSEVRR